jgi:hypothetical protein
MAPKRDIVATDGMKITLGESTVTMWFTPGHTPGTISYTFTVLDRGKPVNVAYSGGTAFNFVNNTPDPGIANFQIYIDSQRHLAEKAKATGATVLLSNHSEFDNAYNKNRMLAGRGSGPHPYDIGAEWVQRYFKVTEGCARAAQLKLEQKVAETAMPETFGTTSTGWAEPYPVRGLDKLLPDRLIHRRPTNRTDGGRHALRPVLLARFLRSGFPAHGRSESRRRLSRAEARRLDRPGFQVPHRRGVAGGEAPLHDDRRADRRAGAGAPRHRRERRQHAFE